MENELKKVKFVQLRTDGFTYTEISNELKVSKPTLIKWSKELKDELHNEFVIKADDLKKKYNLTQERQFSLKSKILDKIEAALEKSELKELPDVKLIDLCLSVSENLTSKDKFIKSSWDDFLQYQEWEA